jgi:quinol monooxygenase YgiN
MDAGATLLVTTIREATMYVQIVNFELDGMTEAEYRQLADQLAPAFEAMDGLLTKLWLADSANGVYGGVYVWADEAACSTYQQSQIWADVDSHPNLVNIRSHEFDLLDAPTALTSTPFVAVGG